MRLDVVKEFIKLNIKSFEFDFDNKEIGGKAKLLHKHYSRILRLLEKVE